MGHKTTFGQICGLKTVGNLISDLIGQTSGLQGQIKTFLICPRKPYIWPLGQKFNFQPISDCKFARK